MHKKSITSILTILCVVLMFSCTHTERKLPASTGKTAEVLFVCNNNFWEGIIGDSVKSIFGAEFHIVSPPEPMFSVGNVEHKNFSKLFEPMRNIVMISIKNDAQNPSIELLKNVWSQPQTIVKLTGKNESEILELLTKNKTTLINKFYENERIRMSKIYKNEENKEITQFLKNALGFTLTFPKGYTISAKGKDFYWIRRETQETGMGILIYTYPYTDTISFNKTYIEDLRDTLTKKHIPGEAKNSYMKISKELILPIAKSVYFKENYATELRGLWNVKGDFMGGAFLSYTFLDKESNKIITLDGYIYSPKFDQKNYIIQLDALMHTFKKE